MYVKRAYPRGMLHPYALPALKLILGVARFFGCKNLARFTTQRSS